ncbi:hypothetical protein BCO18442_07020 [Burkholderia contaminans]|nr:hypothetical protein BCO18442_07020 [Burkholderia contaminans]
MVVECGQYLKQRWFAGEQASLRRKAVKQRR